MYFFFTSIKKEIGILLIGILFIGVLFNIWLIYIPEYTPESIC